MSEQYDADYFLHGKQSGRSLYENYRWMPGLTIPMVSRMIDHLGISKNPDTVLDFGCARGYTVRAFRELGYTSFGYDVSEWAVRNCDPEVHDYVTHDACFAFSQHYDWIIAKDVLEHVEYVDLVINDLMKVARKGLFVVVPLSEFDGLPYAIPDYEKDVTHVQRMTLISWMKMFVKVGWSVTVQYRLEGVKDNWYRPEWEKGNGFITARRV